MTFKITMEDCLPYGNLSISSPSIVCMVKHQNKLRNSRSSKHLRSGVAETVYRSPEEMAESVINRLRGPRNGTLGAKLKRRYFYILNFRIMAHG